MSDNSTGRILSHGSLNIQKILELAKSIRTPIQFASVGIAFILILVLSRASIGIEAIGFALALLPFILLFIVFSGDTLDKIRSGGYILLILMLTLIVKSFVPAILIAESTLSVASSGIVESSKNVFATPARRKRAEMARNDDIRVQSYFDSYQLTAKYYERELDDAFKNNKSGDPYKEVASLRQEMDDLASKILATKSNALDSIYGPDDLKNQVLKFERCQLVLKSMKYLWDVVMTVYGTEGETKTLDQILDVKELPVDEELRASIPKVHYSKIESDLILAVGKSFVTKPINGFQDEDVESIRRAFSSLGYLGDASNGRSSAEILRRFNLSLVKYLIVPQANLPMYKFANLGPQPQIAIYLALYDTGLLDFRKFVIKYAPEKTRPMVMDLLSRQMTLVATGDVDAFSAAILQQEKAAGKVSPSSDIILFKLRDEFRAGIGTYPDAQNVLGAKTAEEFFIRSLEASMDKQGPATAHQLFGGIGLFGPTPGQYDTLVQDFLAYYNVFEAGVIANALTT